MVRVAGFHNQDAADRVFEQGRLFLQRDRREIVGISRHAVDGAALRELDLTLTSYSLAPCWEDEQPYYGLFVERGDLADAEAGRRLTEQLDALLKECNIEYASKRDSLRLGAVRLELLEPGAWREWDRERLKRTGGTLEQYKHPCLIGDAGFQAQMAKRREMAAG